MENARGLHALNVCVSSRDANARALKNVKGEKLVFPIFFPLILRKCTLSDETSYNVKPLKYTCGGARSFSYILNTTV
jgi:hypothetical protein